MLAPRIVSESPTKESRSCNPLGDTRPLSSPPCPVQSTADWFRLPAELVDHPRYEVLEFLGAGGMGVVYKARHRLMQRVVAIKIIKRDFLGRRDVVQRFGREVRAAARLSHPHIVQAYDAEECGAIHFLVMEYIEGLDLDFVLLRDHKLPAEQACLHVRQAAWGLQHAHDRGMIHRDIKPHNLMLTSAGQIKILDFGLARFATEALRGEAASHADGDPRAAPVDPSATCADTLMGTADYTAPEVTDDPRRADIRSDIYSLGCTFYRMLSGKLPCPAESYVEILDCQRRGQIEPLDRVCPDLPARLVGVVERMLRPDPADRYQTPAEVADALTRLDMETSRALVVDDDPAARLVAKRFLTDQGYAVTCVTNGKEALDELRRSGPKPDVILLDLMMPVMDGWRFLHERRKDDALASIPVVVVSSNDARETGALAAGAVDSLRKPMHVSELAAKLAGLNTGGMA